MAKIFTISYIGATIHLQFSPYELVFSRKPKLLLNLGTMPDIKVSGTFKDYYNLLNKIKTPIFKQITSRF